MKDEKFTDPLSGENFLNKTLSLALGESSGKIFARPDELGLYGNWTAYFRTVFNSGF